MKKLGFVISELEKTGNEVVSCNRTSLLVEKGFVNLNPTRTFLNFI